MIIIIFGPAGSGKTYIGNIFSKYFDCHYEDADQWLLPEMKQFILEKKVFTNEMRMNFTQKIISELNTLHNKYKNIVISQALYRQADRDTIYNHFITKTEIFFFQVATKEQKIYKRLLNRGDDISPEYAKSMYKFFTPMQNAIILNNDHDGEAAIIAQIASSLPTLPLNISNN